MQEKNLDVLRKKYFLGSIIDPSTNCITSSEFWAKLLSFPLTMIKQPIISMIAIAV